MSVIKSCRAAPPEKLAEVFVRNGQNGHKPNYEEF